MVSSESHHLIYLNLSESGLSEEYKDWTARGLWHWLQSFGPVALTTTRPNLYPAAYVELVYGPPLGYTRDDFPPGGAASVAPARALQAHNDRWDRLTVWVSGGKVRPHPEPIVAALVHEVGHVYGWPGSHDPREFTADWWELVRSNVPAAAALAARFRRTAGVS